MLNIIKSTLFILVADIVFAVIPLWNIVPPVTVPPLNGKNAPDDTDDVLVEAENTNVLPVPDKIEIFTPLKFMKVFAPAENCVVLFILTELNTPVNPLPLPLIVLAVKPELNLVAPVTVPPDNDKNLPTPTFETLYERITPPLSTDNNNSSTLLFVNVVIFNALFDVISKG